MQGTEYKHKGTKYRVCVCVCVSVGVHAHVHINRAEFGGAV